MTELMCPRCKTTKYRNPSLKLLVNTCGHPLCENCVELLFVRGSGICPQCNLPLRRNNFKDQIFEDGFIQKEVDIRKRVLRDFNKKEEDFPTLQLYNDYLEEVESIIWNLTNDVDVEATKLKVEQYKKENHDIIKKNRSKQSQDDAFLSELIEQEELEKQAYYTMTMKDEDEERQAKKRQEALIDELMFSNLPADHILAQHKQKLGQDQITTKPLPKLRTSVFSSGVKIGGASHNLILPVVEEAEPYEYSQVVIDWLGPSPPDPDDLYRLGYLNHVRKASTSELAGGFVSNLACQRALNDAFCGLFFIPQQDLFLSASTSAMDVS